MKRSRIISDILNVITILLFQFAGVAVIVFSRNEAMFDHSVLGWVLLATSLCRIIRAIIERNTVNERPHELIIPLITFGFGFVVLFSEISMNDVCLYWGLLEICSSSVELTMAFRIIRKELIRIVNVLINVVEFVFGILLCVHMGEGITIHLVITGSLFIALAIEQAVLMVIERRAEKKENDKQD